MEVIWKSKYMRVLTLILLIQAVLFYTASHGDAKNPQYPLQDFPRALGDWHTVGESTIDKQTRDVLQSDEVLSRLYAKPQEQQAQKPMVEDLFVAYFKSQQMGQAPHSPKNCLPGSGFQPIETGVLTVPIPSTGQSITINKYLVEKDGAQSLVLYWFQSHTRVVANEFAEKYYMVADSLRYHRSETALVRVIMPVSNDENLAVDQATSFVQLVYPAICNYLPL